MNKIFLKTLLLSVPILFGSLYANTSDRVEKLEKEMAEITTINSIFVKWYLPRPTNVKDEDWK